MYYDLRTENLQPAGGLRLKGKLGGKQQTVILKHLQIMMED
jgi:hypothetical protein